MAWLDSAGFPTRTTDDTDRGYENLSANAQLRADLGRAEVALRHWRAEGTSEYSDFFLTPVDQDFETSTSALNVAWPVGDAARAQVTTTWLEDRIQQNQSPDYLRTERNSVDAQVDWQASPLHELSFGALFARERASSESYGDRMRAETDSVNLFVQDRIADRRTPRAARPRLRGSRDGRRCRDLEPRVRLRAARQTRCCTGFPGLASARPMRPIATGSAAIRRSSRSSRATSKWACGTGSIRVIPCRSPRSATTSTT